MLKLQFLWKDKMQQMPEDEVKARFQWQTKTSLEEGKHHYSLRRSLTLIASNSLVN
jgi:hypothetical protein